MTREERVIRTGFGVLTESAPPAPSFDEITIVKGPASIRRPVYAALGAGLALMVVAAGIMLADGGMRLAYATEPGLDLTYSATAETKVGEETFSSGPAVVEYRISDAGDGLVDVEISYQPVGDCERECFPAATFTQTVTEKGEIVSIEAPEGMEIPEFVIPTPIPHAGISGGFPLFLGPPLPGTKLAIGDTWETNEDGLLGQHRLVEETHLRGRDVVTIDSTYSFTQPKIGEEVTATARVWFDPEEGIVVQAQIVRNQEWLDKTAEIELQLSE